MPGETVSFIRCPQCGQGLPASAQRCQFCGSVFAGRGGAVAQTPRQMAGVNIISGAGARSMDFTTWEDKAYRICAILFMLMGLVTMFISLGVTPIYPRQDLFGEVISGIQVVMSLLLFFEVEIVQFIAKWYLILVLLNGVLAYLFVAVFFAFSPTLGFILLAVNTIKNLIAGFMLYLIVKVADV